MSNIRDNDSPESKQRKKMVQEQYFKEQYFKTQ